MSVGSENLETRLSSLDAKIDGLYARFEKLETLLGLLGDLWTKLGGPNAEPQNLIGVSNAPSDEHNVKDSVCHPSEECRQEGLSEDSTTPDPGQSSSSTLNSTSTFAYSHEAFASFQHRVRELCTEIGFYRTEIISRMKGGSYNRIVSVTGRASDEAEHSVTGIFRIPRWPDQASGVDQNILNQVVTLNHLFELKVPVPRILAFDATSNNAIQSPYVLQSLGIGARLDTIYKNMSLPEKLCIVDEIVSLTTKLESIRFQTAGRLVYMDAPGQPNSTRLDRSAFMEYDARVTGSQLHVTGFNAGSGDEKITTQPLTSLYDIISDQFDAWLTEEWQKPDDNHSLVARTIGGLRVISWEMKQIGFFDEETHSKANVLYHWDLLPRNVLVERVPDAEGSGLTQRWRISSVLDWDDVLSVPVILTRKPPMWLWTFSEEPDLDFMPSDFLDDDFDLLPSDRYTEESGRLVGDDVQVKQYFEEQMLKSLSLANPSINIAAYNDEAYGKGQWIRRLWRFALHGIESSYDLGRFERFQRDWATFRGRAGPSKSRPSSSLA